MSSTEKNILIFDIETQKSFKEVGGKSSLDKLKVSVVGVYDYLDDEFRCYEEDQMMELEKRIRDVKLLIGFNSRRFDLPVLAPYLFTPVEQIPQLDLLDEIQEQRGHRASLDSLAGPTLNTHKSGSGADAITLFREGKMEALKKYCLDDVRITRDIYEYGCRHGKVLFKSTWDYKTYEIPVTWEKQTSAIFKEATPPTENFPTSLF